MDFAPDSGTRGDAAPAPDPGPGPGPRPALAPPLPLHDPDAMGELLAALGPRMQAVARRVTGDPEAARDVVQSAFEKVLRHGDRFAGHARVSTWVHRIVANEGLMWLRSQRRRREVSADSEGRGDVLAEPAGTSPLEELVRRERLTRLRAGLTALRPEEADVVRRCSLDGWSYAEYGARRGLGVAAVKSRAFRARHRLARLLQGSARRPG